MQVVVIGGGVIGVCTAYFLADAGHEVVLIERHGKLPGQMLGKSPWLHSVHLITDAMIGDLLRVEITAAGPNSVSAVERLRIAA